MFTVKNLQETVAGNLECEILSGDDWTSFIMSPSDEYEIHESSEWPDIKSCDQTEKDNHEQEQATERVNQESLSYLASTDWYVLRQMDSGEVIPEDVKQLRAEARARIV